MMEFVNWDDDRNPILMGKYKIDGNQTTNQLCFVILITIVNGVCKLSFLLYKQHGWEYGYSNIYLVGGWATPLKNDGVRQLG